MNLKSLILSGVSVFAITSASAAADLPVVAEPVNYVKACDAYGNAYFNLPGTETCLAIGGRIRAQIRTGDLANDAAEDWDSYTRGYAWFESETPTDFGSVYTYTGFFYTWNQDGEDSWSSDDAWITFKTAAADLNFGVKLSEYHGFLGYSWMQIGGANWPEYYPLQASVNIPLGDATFSLAVEDASYMDGGDNGVNVVGAFAYDAGMLSMRLAGVATENVNEEYGYAVNLSGEIKPVDNLSFALGGQYAVDASKFINLNAGSYGDLLMGEYGEKEGEDDKEKPDATYFDTLGVEAFSVMGGIKYGLTEKVDVMAEASYLSWETGEVDGIAFDGEATRVSGSLVFKPAKGLGIALAAGWSELTSNGTGMIEYTDEDGNPASKSVLKESTIDEFRVGTRIQYTF